MTFFGKSVERLAISGAFVIATIDELQTKSSTYFDQSVWESSLRVIGERQSDNSPWLIDPRAGIHISVINVFRHPKKHDIF